MAPNQNRSSQSSRVQSRTATQVRKAVRPEIFQLEDRLTPATSISYAGGIYQQLFDTLAATGTITPVATETNPIDLSVAPYAPTGTGLDGWAYAQTLIDGTARFLIEAGTSGTAAANSFGNAASTDRALGLLASGSNVSRIGAVLVNDTAEPITSFSLAYIVEQWRRGSGAANTLAFSYSIGATDINTGTFTAVNPLDAVAPVTTGSSVALDGNLNANRARVAAEVTGITWNPGETLVFRWDDIDDANSDDAIAIDNLFFKSGSFATTHIVDSAADVNDGNFTATNLSLREAMLLADSTPAADTIQFASSLYTSGAATLALSASPINNAESLGASAFVIGTSITIQGPTATGGTDNQLTLSGGGTANKFRFATVGTTGNLTVANVTLSNFYLKGGNGGNADRAGGGGGGAGLGGAVLNYGGTLAIQGVTFTANAAEGGQGGNGGGGSTKTSGTGGGGGGLGTSTLGDGTTAGGAGGPGFAGAFAGGASGINNSGTTTAGFGGGGGGSRTSVGGGVGGFGGGGGGGGKGTNYTDGQNGALGGFGGGTGQSGDGRQTVSTTHGAGGGGAGMGGAVFNLGGNTSIINSTFLGNSAIGGIAGTGGTGTPGVSQGVTSGFTSAQTGYNSAVSRGAAMGGAIFSLNGTLTVINSTITANGLTSENPLSSGRGIYVFSAAPGGGYSLASTEATVNLSNNIVGGSTNTIPDYQQFGVATHSGSNNLVVNNTAIPYTTLTAAPANPGTTTIAIANATALGTVVNGATVLVVDAEQMLVTAGAGGTSLTVTRGYNGTLAAQHSNGARIFNLSDTTATAFLSSAVVSSADPNLVATTLAAAIADTVSTSITVTDASLLEITPDETIVMVGREQMLVTAVSDNILTVTRGVNGTTAATHLNSAFIFSANNGGPTPTIKPLSGPALGGGTDVGAPTTDQRGLPRGLPIDMGALQVSVANLAPTLDNTKTPVLTAQDEDSGVPVGPVGTLISTLVDFATPTGELDNVTDADAEALLGIAVIAADSSNGSWFYSTNNGTNWLPLGSVSDSTARLLAANNDTRIAFQPNADYEGTIDTAITFRAWDRSSGTNGAMANASTNGGASAFSADTDTAALTINPINDAPSLDASKSPALTTQDVDLGAPSGAVGTLVSALVDFASPSGEVDNVSDPDAGALLGIAVTGANSADGSWFFSIDNGANWSPLGTVSDSNAVLLNADASTRLYFQSAPTFAGTVVDGITFRAWDQTTGTNGATADASTNGGTTSFSAATDMASIAIVLMNDAPVLDTSKTPTMLPVIDLATPPSGSVGTLVSALVDFAAPAGEVDNVTDPDSGALLGIAITGFDNAAGLWYYSTDDGVNWFGMFPSTDESTAVLLAADATTRIYLESEVDFFGTATLSFRAWDQTSGSNGGAADTSGSNNGGSTAFSTAIDTASILVDAGAPLIVTDDNISISGATGTAGAYRIGDTVTATWDNSVSGDNNPGVTAVTVDFSQFGGGSAVAATPSGDIWTATFTIIAGTIDAGNRTVSVSATASGGPTTGSDTSNATVDNLLPTVSEGAISIAGATGLGGGFKIGDTLVATWDNTSGGDNNADIDGVTFDLSPFGGGSAVPAMNNSGIWSVALLIVEGSTNSTNANVSVAATDDAGNTTTTADAANAIVNATRPTVLSVSPVIGPTAGGTLVTITGLNLANASSVTFGGFAALSFDATSATSITATAPGHAAGSVDIVVVNSVGVASAAAGDDDFTYATPAVVSVAVNGGAGVVLGGTTWSLAGQNSVVKQILVTFNQAVSVASDAFTVTPVPVSPTINPGPGFVYVAGGASPSTNEATTSITQISPSVYLVTFVDDSADPTPSTHAGGILNSGVYDLTIIASKVTANGESLASDRVETFFAMFGTINANATFTTMPPGSIGDGLSKAFVDPGSLFQFSDTFGSNVTAPTGPPAYNIAFDYNLDGAIDPGDLFAFSDSFGINWHF